MGGFIGAHKQVRCVLVAVCAGVASAAAHAGIVCGARGAGQPDGAPGRSLSGLAVPAGVWGGGASGPWRLQAGGLLAAPASAAASSAARDAMALSPLVLGLYFSVLAGILFYQLLLGLTLRDPAYFHHLGLLASLGVSSLASVPVQGAHLWPDLLDWNARMQTVSFGLLVWCAVLLARSFLRPQGLDHRIDAALRGLAIAWPLALAVLPWAQPEAAARWLAPLGLLTAGVVLWGAVAAWRRTRPGAIPFTLAWLCLMAAALLGLSGVAGGWPVLPARLHVQLLASAVGVVLLCVALADRAQADRAQRERRLAQSVREQVEQEVSHRASLDKSRFLVAVSHDLRQPLYALTLATESMSRQRPLRQPGPMLAQMRSALETADGLLESLYTVARLETGALKPDVVDFSVQPLLERLDQRYAAQARTLDLRWTVTPSLARVHSDPQLLERMLSNLINNALRFTERGGVVVACRLRRGHLLMQVWDTGKGMSVDDQETLFGAHFRGIPESDTDNGVGLGLAIVKQCARLLDIELSMRSCPGKGSCFSLRVPLAAVQDAEA